MIIQAVIYPDRATFESIQPSVYDYFVANNKVDTTVVKEWSKGIDALDESGEVLMRFDNRINGFDFSPYSVIEVSTDNPKWF